MSELTTVPTIADDPADAALRDFLERSPVIVDGGAEVVRIARQPLRSSTSYDTAAVTVELSDGRAVRTFLKDFGHSLRPKDEPNHRRDREMRFYRDLAPHGELGVPRYYGSIWDDAQERHWLLLEFVEGTPVRYCGFEHWVAAANWLGRMHGHFWPQRDQLAGCSFLERLDTTFFRTTVVDAITAVTAFSPELGTRLESVLHDYEGVVQAMLRPPHTLLHGGYHMLNVLTCIPGQPDRMCVIDWEEVGLGSPLSDLSYLVDGFDPARLDELLATYCSAAAPFGLSLPERAEMVHVMNCFRLHKRIASLPKYVQWKDPWKTVPKLVALVETYASEVR